MTTLKEKIQKLELGSVIKRVHEKKGIEGAMLAKAEELYRNYLYLRAKYPNETLVPPKLADEVWHEHIMASKQYMNDCQTIFGEYLHHNETDDEPLLEKGWQTTQTLYKKEFEIDILKAGYAAGGCT